MWEDLAGGKKTALVLAGGGARGAYEVGVIQGLAKLGFEPDLIAGTSIGALNGSMVAQKRDLKTAGEALHKEWSELGEARIIRPNRRKIVRTLGEIGMAQLLGGVGRVRTLLFAKLFSAKEEGYLDTEPIEELVERLVNPEELRVGRPFWVAVTNLLSKEEFPLRHLVESARAWIVKDVKYIAPGHLPDGDLFRALLASAAIPVAFPSQEIGGRRYLDGGIVDNMPVKAIKDHGCGLVVVVHLSNGTLWERRDFPELDILEIRPSAPVQQIPGLAGWAHSLLDFSGGSIERLRQLGEGDALRIIGDLERRVRLHRDARESRARLRESTRLLMEEPPLDDW